jgi:hypothetical protein
MAEIINLTEHAKPISKYKCEWGATPTPLGKSLGLSKLLLWGVKCNECFKRMGHVLPHLWL